MSVVHRAVVALALVAGCGGSTEPSDTTPPPDDPPPPACDGTLLPDQSCLNATAGPCAEGFVAEGDACVAILPAAACADGMAAVPGDEVCRPLGDCGDGPWGNIADGADVEHVDPQAAPGGDGSRQAPWTTVTEAWAAVAPGGTIALTDGDYAEHLVVSGKPVQLLGRCAERVTFIGLPSEQAAIEVSLGADGSRFADFAVTGDASFAAIGHLASHDVHFERLWLHDLPTGILVQDFLAPASAVVTDLVVERTDVGIAAVGATVVASRVTVRDSVPGSLGGMGLLSQTLPGGAPGRLELADSWVDGAGLRGITTQDGSLVIARTAVTATQGFANSEGSGIVAASMDLASSAEATLTDLFLQGNRTGGMVLSDAAGVVNRVTVRNTTENPEGGTSAALLVQFSQSVTLSNSVFESNVGAGVFAESSVLEIADSVVRDTVPNPTSPPDGSSGAGIIIQALSGPASQATLQRTLVERATRSGIAILASGVTIDSSAVVATQHDAATNLGGRAVQAQNGTALTMSNTLLADNAAFGLMVVDADAVVERSRITDTTTSLGTGAWGDGVVVMGWESQASVLLQDSTIVRSARAGAGIFGGQLSVSNSTIECNLFDLNAEPFLEQQPLVEDLGGNRCGCNDDPTCKASSSGLTPPAPLGP